MFGPLPPGLIVLIIAIGLLLFPVKLPGHNLKRLAFAIWMIGGIAMTYNGILRLHMANLDSVTYAIAIFGSAIVGIAKGKFVLSKTSDKNIERLDALTEPQKPIMVYSGRSWIIIGLMAVIAISLNVFEAPPLWRGIISLGIGLALVVSSLRYLAKPKSSANAI